MKVYRYKEFIIPENKVQKRLKSLGITMEDLEEITEKRTPVSDKFPFEYRLNVNTVLCAFTKEGLDELKREYGVLE